MGINLIVGLGNPGTQYAKTRHNAGAWLVEKIAQNYDATFNFEPKFFGSVATVDIDGHPCKLLLPSTFMNCSGKAVQALAKFHKIPRSNILVAHDELDFPAGTIKLKFDGGDNGHKGLKDIIAATGGGDFYRLRIGIGRPQSKADDVVSYVLKAPSKNERSQIDDAIDRALLVLPLLMQGGEENIGQAMQMLHTKATN